MKLSKSQHSQRPDKREPLRIEFYHGMGRLLVPDILAGQSDETVRWYRATHTHVDDTGFNLDITFAEKDCITWSRYSDMPSLVSHLNPWLRIFTYNYVKIPTNQDKFNAITTIYSVFTSTWQTGSVVFGRGIWRCALATYWYLAGEAAGTQLLITLFY